MTTTLAGLRDGLRTNLATISGLRAYDTVPDNPSPPFAVILPSSIRYWTAMNRGVSEYEFTILVVVGRVSERIAQDTLDSYCNPSGSTSVPVAVESSPTLGGQAFDCRVVEMRNYQQLAIGEVTYLAAEFVVQVIAE